jgi:hypothetical protein
LNRPDQRLPPSPPTNNTRVAVNPYARVNRDVPQREATSPYAQTNQMVPQGSPILSPRENDPMFVYVLILEQDKWYVGYSERPIGPRLLEHFNHNGAMWTTTYRPLQVMEIRPGGLNEENELTLEMMDKYGWWNVRGGRWCQVNMNAPPPELLARQGLVLPPELNRPDQRLPPSPPTNNTRVAVNPYARVNRDVPQREATNPYAQTNQMVPQGSPILSPREATNPYAQVNQMVPQGSQIPWNQRRGPEGACFRCGRPGHFVRDCYARTSINGNRLKDSDAEEDDFDSDSVDSYY